MFMLFSTVFFLCCLALAALNDLRAMRIPNNLTLVLLSGFAPAALVLGVPVLSHIITFAVMALVCFGLFYFGLFGGGDAKLLPVVALWVGPAGLPVFLLAMAVAGGALSAFTLGLPHVPALARVRWRDGSWPARAVAGERAVPYGVAILMGALAVCAQMKGVVHV